MEKTVERLAVFKDEDATGNAAMSFLVVSSNKELVIPSVTDGMITLDFQDNQHGAADITVYATSDGDTVSDTFKVSIINDNKPPVVANGLPDITVMRDDPDLVIPLLAHLGNESYTFTNAGAKGVYGPTQNEVDVSYGSGNPLNGSVKINTRGIQELSLIHI